MTQAEKTFLNRMVPHMMAGLSFEEAGRAVLADDERIWLATMAQDDTGLAIRQNITTLVYANLRAKA
jgi:hypothetical protein